MSAPGTNRVYRIGVIPGDGIGKEVVPEGIAVAGGGGAASSASSFDWSDFDWSCETLRQDRPDDAGGRARPDRGRSMPSFSARSAIPACPTTSRCGGC